MHTSILKKLKAWFEQRGPHHDAPGPDAPQARLATVLPLAAVCAMTGLGGCATSMAPETDAAFGLSVREAMTAQTLRRQTVVNPWLPDTLDGPMARAALQHARQQFSQPPSSTGSSVIGAIGGSAAR